MTALVLHNYWRSSASQRVRIALGLKSLTYDYVAHSLIKGEQLTDAYRAKNPMAQLPAFEIVEDDGRVTVLTQSLAILEYIDERWPDPPIMPKDPVLRARARALAEIVNSGIQPLQNLTTTNAVNALGGKTAEWVRPFIANGLAAYEAACKPIAGTFSIDDNPSIADCCLIPQLASARRFDVDYTHLTKLVEIEKHCLAMPAFAKAMPDQQPDAVSSNQVRAE